MKIIFAWTVSLLFVCFLVILNKDLFVVKCCNLILSEHFIFLCWLWNCFNYTEYDILCPGSISWSTEKGSRRNWRDQSKRGTSDLWCCVQDGVFGQSVVWGHENVAYGLCVSINNLNKLSDLGENSGTLNFWHVAHVLIGRNPTCRDQN